MLEHVPQLAALEGLHPVVRGEEVHDEGYAQVRHSQVRQEQLAVALPEIAPKVWQAREVQNVVLGAYLSGYVNVYVCMYVRM
jgi:hypothetical protein